MADLSHGTWVLIADGEKALFLENQGDEDYPHLVVRRMEEQENPPDREQGTDKAGRFNDGPSVHRSAVQETNWHQLAEDRFASELSEILYKQAHWGGLKRLVIAAAPRTLGELRTQIHSQVEDRIVCTIDKVLTNHPIEEIEKIVKDEMTEK